MTNLGVGPCSSEYWGLRAVTASVSTPHGIYQFGDSKIRFVLTSYEWVSLNARTRTGGVIGLKCESLLRGALAFSMISVPWSTRRMVERSCKLWWDRSSKHKLKFWCIPSCIKSILEAFGLNMIWDCGCSFCWIGKQVSQHSGIAVSSFPVIKQSVIVCRCPLRPYDRRVVRPGKPLTSSSSTLGIVRTREKTVRTNNMSSKLGNAN